MQKAFWPAQLAGGTESGALFSEKAKARERLAKPLAARYAAHLLVWRTKPQAAQVELSLCTAAPEDRGGCTQASRT